MRAIRFYGPHDVRLDDIPEPILGPGQVKVKVCVIVPSATLHCCEIGPWITVVTWCN
ncbi:hypothetical protein BD414DRAFT_485614 [Trametes punicea]|nr:hypothetical protein BD414DRAFT_485614 [Trametes punicea]